VEFQKNVITIHKDQIIARTKLLHMLVQSLYSRTTADFRNGNFRVKGDVVDVFPSYADHAFRIHFFGDEIERLMEINVLTGEVLRVLDHLLIFPASHYVVAEESIDRALKDIEAELEIVVKDFKEEDKLLEAQRIAQRTNFDMEMIRETGFCSGIENYSRHLTGLAPGQAPHTLFDYFPEDFVLMIDESHKSIPQIRGMFAGDQSRKSTLVDYGFRLPSAKDNRPLNFSEFEKKINKVLYVSATPGPYEKEHQDMVII
jgi:excinuclease ABC subunit B